jgi:hypothetical protein
MSHIGICVLCGEKFDTNAEKDLYFDDNSPGVAHGKCVQQLSRGLDPRYATKKSRIVALTIAFVIHITILIPVYILTR